MRSMKERSTRYRVQRIRGEDGEGKEWREERNEDEG